MSDPPTNEVVLVHLTYLREQVDEVVAHLRTQNGKLDKHAEKLAEHATAIEVFRDRASEARTSGAKWGAGVGAFVAALVAGLWSLFGGGGR